MGVIAVCGVLLLVGLVAGVAWSGRPFQRPEPLEDLPATEVGRRYTWYVALTLTAGVAAGITVIGAGGRLAMRLLAVTAGDAAQGRLTEAEEEVGRITVDGTIGFVAFNGILGGLVFGGVYLIVRRYLPAGLLGGVAYGLALLVVLGTTADPLRRDNPDFDIVGPGWLAAVVFTLLAVAFGVTLASMTARLSAWLPLPSPDRRVLLRYVLPAVLAVVAFFVTGLLIALGLLVVLVTRWRPVLDAVRSPRALVVGRVLVSALVLVSLPQAVASVVDIAGR